MELREFISVVLRRLWLIVLAIALVGGMTYALSVSSTPIYSATATLHIDFGADPRTDPYTGLRTSEASAKTYVEMMKSTDLLQEVINTLALPVSAKELQGALNVQQIRDTQLIQVSVEDSNPGRAAATANEIARTLMERNQTAQRARYEPDQAALDAEIADLEQKIEQTQIAITALGDPLDPQNQNMPEYVRMERTRLQAELTRLQTIYVMRLNSAEDLRLAAARYEDNVTLFSEAQTPTSPIKPRILLNTILGLLSGAVLGVSTAFLLEYLDDTIKTQEEVSAVLDLPTLGNVTRIPGVKELKDGLIALKEPRSPLVEAYRALRTNVQFSLVGNPSASILVTSAGPKEGKSTTLANLGTVMAQAGKRIILADTDLRRPTLHEFFEVPREPGLTDLLLDEEPRVDDYLRETKIPGLRLMPSGPLPPNPSELLSSPQAGRIFEELKERADVVLFDSPPVLAVTDATILSTKVRGVLLVLDAGTTRSDVAQQGQEALTQVGATILGVVLNRQKKGRGGYYHYYY
ncbi:MAG TPA: polysaccharide biosynthesis tyrosine autokinase, partial [Chloroflexi bacterium]|nr:polysaccharide biosynthesis tyrosine autokinase [Chloroflexota bacterium]